MKASDQSIALVKRHYLQIRHALKLGRTALELSVTRVSRSGDQNVPLLDLGVGHLQTKLVNSTLDGIPSGKSRREVHAAVCYLVSARATGLPLLQLTICIAVSIESVRNE